MRTKIEGSNWTGKLAGAVESAKAGDTIEVSSWAAAQLGHGAAQRMHGETHGIVFEVNGRMCPYSDTDDPPPEWEEAED